MGNYPPGFDPDTTIQFRLPVPEDRWQTWKDSVGRDTTLYARLNTLIETDADDRPPSIPEDVWREWLETLVATQDPADELRRLVERDTKSAAAVDDGGDVNEKAVSVFAMRIRHRARTARSELASDSPDGEHVGEQLDEIMRMAESLDD